MVVVVVRGKGAIKLVDLGGAILYIFTVPVTQLTPLEMDERIEGRNCTRSRLESLKAIQTAARDPDGEESLERSWGNTRRSQGEV